MGSRSRLWFVTFLTFIRFPLVLVFVAAALVRVYHPDRDALFYVAFAALLASAVTDWLDGHFARRLRVETRFGAHADPLMDKLFYLATLPLLVFVVTENGHIRHGLFLVCITVFFLARDQWVTFLRSIGSMYNVSGGATWSGKLRTSINFPLICAIYYFEEAPVRLVDVHLLYAAEVVACIVNVISLYTYTRRYWPYLHLSTLSKDGAAHETPSLPAMHAEKAKALGRMASGVTHDFSNFLAAILGNAGIVRKGLPADSPLRQPVAQIEETAQQAVELTNRLQTYMGKGRASFARTDLSALVAGMREGLAGRLPPGMRLDCATQPDLAPVEADAALVRRLLLILVANAAESAADEVGEVRVRTLSLAHDSLPADAVWFDAPPPPGPQAAILVSDRGGGIPPALLPRIFDPFFSTKMRAQGLGLPEALGIMRAHGGAMAVHSAPGHGSVFAAVFPRRRDQAGGPNSES
ncbi:MAG: hypothetical protein FJ225_04615 [Lentisphaerae bacterium]|nr:hypothetical protein [Lentisphaerota bacterium]